MNVFVLNCGSSSVKYKLFDMESGPAEPVLAEGRIERIGARQAIVVHKSRGREHRSVRPVFEHRDAIGLVLNMMATDGEAAGGEHRVGYRPLRRPRRRAVPGRGAGHRR